MAKKPFSLRIGSLLFRKDSLIQIIFGFFLLGVLAGLLSIIHIDNPGISQIATMPLNWAMVIPIIIVGKGVRKAEVVN